MKREVFKQVLGFSNYLVSNYGRIYNKQRKRFLVPVTDIKGYQYVNLSQMGKTKTCKVHRLVVEAFLGRHLKPGEDVHHLVSKTDNCLQHIIVLTHSDHMKLHKYGSHHSEETKAKIKRGLIEYWKKEKAKKEEEL